MDSCVEPYFLLDLGSPAASQDGTDQSNCENLFPYSIKVPYAFIYRWNWTMMYTDDKRRSLVSLRMTEVRVTLNVTAINFDTTQHCDLSGRTCGTITGSIHQYRQPIMNGQRSLSGALLPLGLKQKCLSR